MYIWAQSMVLPIVNLKNLVSSDASDIIADKTDNAPTIIEFTC